MRKRLCDSCGGDIGDQTVLKGDSGGWWHIVIDAEYRNPKENILKERDLCVKCLAALVHATYDA